VRIHSQKNLFVILLFLILKHSFVTTFHGAIAGATTGLELPTITFPFLVGAATGTGARTGTGTDTGTGARTGTGTDTGDAAGGDIGAAVALHEMMTLKSPKRF
jgi:hypothetical protein